MPHSDVSNYLKEEQTMGIIWTIVIGFFAGVIAKFIMPEKTSLRVSC